MKKIILLITVIFAVSASYAQDDDKKGWFGIKAGGVVATMDGGTGYSNDPHFGATAGFFYEHMIGRKVSLSVDLLYSGQGMREKDKEMELNERMDLHYIILPVAVNYYIVKGLAVKVGIQPGFLASAVSVDKNSYGNSKSEFAEDCRRFDISVPMGISYDINKFRIEARYNLGLLSLTKDDDEKIYNNWNSVFALTVGFKF